MEIIEIISNFINKDNNVVEVEFRMDGDDETVVRIDTIEFEYLNSFGYAMNLPTDIFDDMDEEWDLDFDDNEFEEFSISEEDLISFLNEYYDVFDDRIPDAEQI